MINHYSLLLDLARERQKELLYQAEAERLYKQLNRNDPNQLHQIERYLAGIIKQLKVHSQSIPATSIFGEK